MDNYVIDENINEMNEIILDYFSLPVDKLIILYYMLTLNSVVNPWIYMMFNFNLVESLRVILCPCISRRTSRPVSPNNPLRRSKRFILCCKTTNKNEDVTDNRKLAGDDKVTTSLMAKNESTSRGRKSSSPPQETQVTFCRVTPTKMV